jgi:hypothetical protein
MKIWTIYFSVFTFQNVVRGTRCGLFEERKKDDYEDFRGGGGGVLGWVERINEE